jgi:AcrR family transcriptional regulator
MRADARRNRQAVLDAGARLLADRPAASMQEIADASGVGRTTVYRHFPAREDLVAALIQQVVGQVVNATATALAVRGPAPDVLRRFAADLVVLGGRWRFLRDQRLEVLAMLQESDRAFLQWAREAQRRGELRTDMTADWLLAVTKGVLTSANDEVERLGVEETGRLAGETLVSAFTPRR